MYELTSMSIYFTHLFVRQSFGFCNIQLDTHGRGPSCYNLIRMTHYSQIGTNTLTHKKNTHTHYTLTHTLITHTHTLTKHTHTHTPIHITHTDKNTLTHTLHTIWIWFNITRNFKRKLDEGNKFVALLAKNFIFKNSLPAWIERNKILKLL